MPAKPAKPTSIDFLRRNLTTTSVACMFAALTTDGALFFKDYIGSMGAVGAIYQRAVFSFSVDEVIRDGALTLAHGIALSKLPSDKEQIRMAKRITDHYLSAKKAEIAIERYLEKGRVEEKKPAASVPDGETPGIYIKDSRDMSELPDKSVHLIVSSPPYGVGMEYEKGVSFDEHLEMVGGVLKECARVLVEGGIIALNVGDISNFKGRKEKNDFHQIQLMGHMYQNVLRKFQIYLTDQIIWKKSLNWKKRPDVSFNEETPHCSYRILDNWEPIYIFRKKGERTVPSEEVVLKSKLTKEQWTAWAQGVWAIEPVRKQEGHPAVFPDELPRRLIMMFSYEGDNILDPWLGSGTTVKVARELNRVGIGYEKEAQYKEVIMRKLGISSKAEEHKEVDKKIESLKETFASATRGEDAFPEPVKVNDEEEKVKQSVEHADDYLEAEVGQVA
jgi:DNA modification methylase